MSEPVSGIAFDSMIDQVYPKAPFTEQKFMVRAVLPEHTFLEKIFPVSYTHLTLPTT